MTSENITILLCFGGLAIGVFGSFCRRRESERYQADLAALAEYDRREAERERKAARERELRRKFRKVYERMSGLPR